ncbi:MAG: hypothetical protein ACR2FJ_02540 [Qipengyuania sp.]
MLSKIATATAAMALVAAPVAAQVDTSRAAAPVEGASELEGQATLFWVLGIAAIVAAVILLSEDDDDPVSP